MTGLTVELVPMAGGWKSLSVDGEVDLSNVAQLEAAIEEVYGQEDGHLVVDLTETPFMDSTALRALIASDQRFRDSGRSFAVAVKGGPISRLIDISGLGGSLDIVSTPEDVLRAED